MPSEKINKLLKQLIPSFDSSKVAVGIYSHFSCEEEMFYYFFEESPKDAWAQIEYLITLCFDRSVPCFEECHIYEIPQNADDEIVCIDTGSLRSELEKAMFEKYVDFCDNLDECNDILLTLDEFDNEPKAKTEKYFIDPRDNQRYKIAKIGNQVWLAENLRFKTERARPYEDDESLVSKFGYLYDREDSRIVAPKGWRLPSIQDFESLETYIKEHSKNKVSIALKSKTEWKKTQYTEGNGVDEFGMNILPAGYRCMQGVPHGRGMYTAFWTSSGDDFFHAGSFFSLGSFNYDEIGDSFVGYISIRLIKE